MFISGTRSRNGNCSHIHEEKIFKKKNSIKITSQTQNVYPLIKLPETDLIRIG